MSIGSGRRRIIDGPYLETKEQLGGFALLEVGDLDEAMAWAERTPWNGDGCTTEIRPVMDYARRRWPRPDRRSSARSASTSGARSPR